MNVSLDRNGIRIDGEPRVLLCASLFYFRIPAELWQDRIDRIKAAGYNSVDVYFPWNFHESTPGHWDFTGMRDAGRFLDLLAASGLWVVARPGPYICSEWDGGAVPAWILAGGKPFRQNDPGFLAAVREWFSRILPILAPRQIERGGSIVLVQLENELDFSDCPDPKAYMEALARMAREFGITVPLFGCAGQFSLERATGRAADVHATFNAYPARDDADFDRKCGRIAEHLSEIDQPLLITETQREHALLRRELANGAKLLGAYNQVAGTNFGFTNSINNWGIGDPTSFIATLYDFQSIVDPAGRYRPEALEGRLLGRLIRAYGPSLAAARVRLDGVFSFDCGFPTATVPSGVLALEGGGFLVCVPNLSAQKGTARVKGPGVDFDVTVGAWQSPLLPVGVPIGRTGFAGRIRYASAELVVLEKGLLVFHSDDASRVVLASDAGEVFELSSRDGSRRIGSGTGAVEVRFLSRAEAARYEPEGRWTERTDLPVLGESTLAAGRLAMREPDAKPVAASGRLAPRGPDGRPSASNGAIGMEALGLYRGFAFYEPKATGRRPLLLRGVADLLDVCGADGWSGVRTSPGQWRRIEPTGVPVRIRVESWGHSNFEDPRRPSLRMGSPKGIQRIYEVLEEGVLNDWRFRLADEWAPARLAYASDPFDAPLGLDLWNSTRRPLLALYYMDVRRTADADAWALSVADGTAEVAVYADGTLVGILDPNDPTLLLPEPMGDGTMRLELLCRKRDFSEPVGTARLHQLRTCTTEVRSFGEEELAALDAGEGETFALPSDLPARRVVRAGFDLDGLAHRCQYLRLTMRDCKATVVFNERVVGRIFGESAERPSVVGGDAACAYLPAPWFRPNGNRLVLLLEPTGPAPRLEPLRFEILR